METFPKPDEIKSKTEDKTETLYDVEIDTSEQVKTKYDLSPEEVLNPENMPALPETKQSDKKEGFVAAFPQTNPAIWGVLREHALRDTMSNEDIEALASEMVHGYDEETNFIEEAQASEVLEEAEVENKQEIAKQKETKPSLFARAVEVMKGFLEKHPKLAKLAVIGTVGYELANNPAAARGFDGYPMQPPAYTQMQQGRANEIANQRQIQSMERSQYQADMRMEEDRRRAAYNNQMGGGYQDGYYQQGQAPVIVVVPRESVGEYATRQVVREAVHTGFKVLQHELLGGHHR